MAKILDGKIVRDILAAKIQKELKQLKAKPALLIIQVGENPFSSIYIRQKKLFGEKLGFLVTHIQLKSTISENDLVEILQQANANKTVHGIIVQLPLPKHINALNILNAILPEKDIDGLSAKNMRRLLENTAGGFMPATTKGILSLLDFYKIPVAGKKVAIVGRSLLVGKPTALALMNKNATVTICHRETKHIKDEVRKADIVIAAVGHPKLIAKSFVKAGQIIIDVGISKVGGKLVGDVDFAAVSKVVKAITPVPGGIGPMTVVSLFENLLDAYRLQNML